jgi:hypothetical protein
MVMNDVFYQDERRGGELGSRSRRRFVIVELHAAFSSAGHALRADVVKGR